MGIASKLHIKCKSCQTTNIVNTSRTHKSGFHGPQAFDNNSRAVLGTLDGSIGETHLNTILTTMNIPPISRNTFKRREREVGLAVEQVAKRSCLNVVMKERDIEIKKGAVEDENGLIGLACSYDMGWQKRGRAFNSLTGHGAVMGLQTGKIMGYASRNKRCRFCDSPRGRNNLQNEHNCRKNHTGSSKIMETDVACQLFKEAPQGNVKFSSYVGDDDSTTLAELVKQTPYQLQKYSDIIHMKRSLSTRLYNLSQRSKFSNCSILSQKVINYLIKCFSYCVHQNKDNKSELSKHLKCIVPHAFGDHSNCDQSWCRFYTNPEAYHHNELPYGKDLHGEELKNALTLIFEEYTTDVVLEKLTPCLNSQRNESLNGTIGSKNIKIRYYGDSGSSDFRLACGIAQRNEGHQYVSKTLTELGIDPGEQCVEHHKMLDRKQEKDNNRKATAEL